MSSRPGAREATAGADVSVPPRDLQSPQPAAVLVRHFSWLSAPLANRSTRSGPPGDDSRLGPQGATPVEPPGPTPPGRSELLSEGATGRPNTSFRPATTDTGAGDVASAADNGMTAAEAWPMGSDTAAAATAAVNTMGPATQRCRIHLLLMTSPRFRPADLIATHHVRDRQSRRSRDVPSLARRLSGRRGGFLCPSVSAQAKCGRHTRRGGGRRTPRSQATAAGFRAS
jgi:hypothetical protein